MFHVWGTPQLLLNLSLGSILLTSIFWLAPVFLFWRTLLWALRWQKDVRHRVVLITGASSGIGSNVALEYAKRGAIVVLVARRRANLDTVASKCLGLGSPDVFVIPGDVANEDDCKRIVEATVQRYGSLDVLWNNAGIAQYFLFPEATTTEGFKKIFDVDFFGYVYMTYYALPHLRKSRGQIVVTGSVLGLTYFPGTSLYNAAKHAVHGFYDTLRVEVGSEVDITTICPGFTKSEMTDGKAFFDEAGEEPTAAEALDKRNAIGGGLYPVVPTEKFARAAVYCACKRQRYAVIPAWYWAFFFYRVFAPELLDLSYKLLLLPRSGKKPSVAKTVLDKAEGGYLAPTLATLKTEGHRRE